MAWLSPLGVIALVGVALFDLTLVALTWGPWRTRLPIRRSSGVGCEVAENKGEHGSRRTRKGNHVTLP